MTDAAAAGARTPGLPPGVRWSIILAVAIQVALSFVSGWQNRHVLNNPDGVAYIRSAVYVAQGQFGLSVSGHWGPLLSWMAAGPVRLGADPIPAMRIALGLSALIFTLGCLSVLRSVQTPPVGLAIGTWLAALASVVWSSWNITPDVLLAGLVALASSRLLSGAWRQGPLSAFVTGLVCGAVCLAKPVGLALILTISTALALLSIGLYRLGVREAVRGLAPLALGVAMVAGPWMAILSHKYGSLTFSTSNAITRAVVGPPNRREGESYVSRFHVLEAGRITSWEDPPPHLPDLVSSPLDSPSYTWYQAKLIRDNTSAALAQLARFDLVGLGIATAIAGLLLHKPWLSNLRSERWRWGGLLVVCVVAPYLPLVVELRYLFPAYPFVLAAAAGTVSWLTSESRRGLRMLCWGFLALSFGGPLLTSLPAAVGTSSHPSLLHRQIARRLGESGLQGPIAGGRTAGLEIAFFLNQPWYGDEPDATVSRLKASGAKLVVARRDSPLAAGLEREPGFRNVDAVAFDGSPQAEASGLTLYVRTEP